MDRELTFHPEKEHARDLVYSEYSSCDRSVHLLIQESPSVPYEAVLRLYRETVSAYLCSEEIRPPEDFVQNLLSRFDDLARDSGLPFDSWRTLGIHLLLRTRNAIHIITSREAEVLLRVGNSLEAVSAVSDPTRLTFDRGAAQRELFPSRLGDMLLVLRVEPARVGGRDLVLGCGESDRAAVLQGLSDPTWFESEAGSNLRASRRSIVSGSVSQRILVLRLGEEGGEPVRATATQGTASRRWFPFLVRGGLAVAGIAAVLAVAVGLYRARDTREPTAGGGEGSGVSETAPSPRSSPVGETVPPERTAGTETFRLAEVWRRKFTAPVTSSPVLVGGDAIFGCRDGSVYAVDRGTGISSWTFKTSGGVGASPAVDGERVVVADYNGSVYALRASDGTEVWRAKLPTSVVSSPAVAADRVLVCGVDGNAYCLAAADGRAVWTRRTGGRIRGSAVTGGNGFLVPSYDGYLYAMSAVLGTVLWRSAMGGPVSSTPAAADGWVVVGAPDGVRCVNAADGSTRWSYKAGDAVKSSLAVSGDKAIFGSNDGCLYCLDLSTGALRWKYQTGGIVLARPAESGGVVYAGSYDGRLYALVAADGKLLAAFEAGGEVFSSPAVDGERVYFGTNGGDFVALSLGRIP